MILVSSVALCINMLSLLNFYLLIIYQNLYIVPAFVLVLIFLVIWVIDDNNQDHTIENGRAPN